MSRPKLISLLVEGIEDFKKVLEKTNSFQFQALTDNNDELLKRLIELDPTSDLSKDVLGIYSKLLITKFYKKKDPYLQAVLRHSNREDDSKVRELLNHFNNPKIKSKLPIKDLGQYSSLDDLYADVDKIINTDELGTLAPDLSEKIKEIKQDITAGNLQKVLFGQKYIVLIPKNRPTACKYTQYPKRNWCTGNPNNDSFSSYNDRPLYMLFNKNTMEPEYQFYFGGKMDDAFMDKDDHQIPIINFFEENQDVYFALFPIQDKLDNKEPILDRSATKYMPKSIRAKYAEYTASNNLSIYKLIEESTRNNYEGEPYLSAFQPYTIYDANIYNIIFEHPDGPKYDWDDVFGDQFKDFIQDRLRPDDYDYFNESEYVMDIRDHISPEYKELLNFLFKVVDPNIDMEELDSEEFNRFLSENYDDMFTEIRNADDSYNLDLYVSGYENIKKKYGYQSLDYGRLTFNKDNLLTFIEENGLQAETSIEVIFRKIYDKSPSFEEGAYNIQAKATPDENKFSEYLKDIYEEIDKAAEDNSIGLFGVISKKVNTEINSIINSMSSEYVIENNKFKLPGGKIIITYNNINKQKTIDNIVKDIDPESDLSREEILDNYEANQDKFDSLIILNISILKFPGTMSARDMPFSQFKKTVNQYDLFESKIIKNFIRSRLKLLK